MAWSNIAAVVSGQHKIEQMAEDIACRSWPSIATRFSDSMHSMTAMQARGYVRARARGIVHQEVTKELAKKCGNWWQVNRAEVVEKTLQAVVRRAVNLELERRRQADRKNNYWAKADRRRVA